MRALAALTLALLLSGCVPDEFLLWSPDGQLAFVRGKQPALIDATGKLLGPQLGENEWAEAWMPDSKRILMVRRVEAKSWEEYTALLGSERVESLTALAEHLFLLISSYHGDWAAFGDAPGTKLWDESLQLRGEPLTRVAWFVEHHHPGALEPLFAAAAKAGDKEKTNLFLSERPPQPSINELWLRSARGGDDAPADLLARVPDALMHAWVAPHGRAVVFSVEGGQEDELLLLALTPGAKPTTIATGANTVAWSPDGTSLVLFGSSVPKPLQSVSVPLGTLSTKRVCAADGTLLEKPEDDVECAIVMQADWRRPAWLPDGRLLFAGMPLTLPAAPQGDAPPVGLFVLDPTKPHGTIEQLLPDDQRAQLPERPSCFLPSPDGQKFAISDETGAVSVFDLATRKVLRIQEAIPRLKGHDTYNATQPAWRTAEELCYVAPAGSPQASPERSELVAINLTTGEKKTLSRSWPNSKYLPPNLEPK